MYPSKFQYKSVQSIDDAVEALSAHENAEILAGGQSLIPLQKTRFAAPEYLIDITDIDKLRYIDVEDDTINVGALATHTEIQQAGPIQEYVPLFSECIGQIADWLVRNQGTFGGTIAEADPSGDYLPVMKVLNPDIELYGPDGNRKVPFNEFYLGMFTVDMDDEEIITGARIPRLSTIVPNDVNGVGSTYKKYSNRSGDYAIVGVAAVIAIDELGEVLDAKISIGGVGPLTSVSDAEKIIEGTKLDEETLSEATMAVQKTVTPDEEGPEGEYKEAMAKEFTKRAMRTAYKRAKGEQ